MTEIWVRTRLVGGCEQRSFNNINLYYGLISCFNAIILSHGMNVICVQLIQIQYIIVFVQLLKEHKQIFSPLVEFWHYLHTLRELQTNDHFPSSSTVWLTNSRVEAEQRTQTFPLGSFKKVNAITPLISIYSAGSPTLRTQILM